MFFLLSGEGPTDIGESSDGMLISTGVGFQHGPMSLVVDQVVEQKHDYSILDCEACGFISETRLTARASKLKAIKKSLGLPGKKQAVETRYYFNHARVLARVALELEAGRKEQVVAILFRDSDGTASAGRGLWAAKRESIIDGFEIEAFERGVPMVPKPKSEAWILCALKANPYENCEALEYESGNDRSPHSLKVQVAEVLDDSGNVSVLCANIRNKTVDINKISMPSFSAFRERLESLL